MKKKLFPLITFLLGLIVGVACMILLVQRGPNQVIANLGYAFIRQNVTYAYMLAEKRYAELQQTIEEQLLVSLDQQRALKLSDEIYAASCKTVQQYFTETNRRIPDLIQAHLNQNLPSGGNGKSASAN